jgi:hypothetical protein
VGELHRTRLFGKGSERASRREISRRFLEKEKGLLTLRLGRSSMEQVEARCRSLGEASVVTPARAWERRKVTSDLTLSLSYRS